MTCATDDRSIAFSRRLAEWRLSVSLQLMELREPER